MEKAAVITDLLHSFNQIRFLHLASLSSIINSIGSGSSSTIKGEEEEDFVTSMLALAVASASSLSFDDRLNNRCVGEGGKKSIVQGVPRGA